MKSILVPVEACDGVNAQLSAALLVAGRFDAHIDGIAPFNAIEALTFGNGAVGISTATLENFERDQRAARDNAQKYFREFMQGKKIAWGEPGPDAGHVSADWLAEREGGDLAIGHLARLYDLTVLARPVSGEPVPRDNLLDTILFESGRPVLIVPPDVPEKLGEVIVLAWNGSTESARAISFAQPLLAKAKRVVVLSVEGGMIPGPEAGEVQHVLSRAGIAADVNLVQQTGRTVGEAILAEARHEGADLLIKGAYTHSRLRQMIFGGATKHILTEARVPVLMAH